jgi:uncharacterized repeat protein (TIGR01451 family)
VALVNPGAPAGGLVADDVLVTSATPDGVNTNNTSTAVSTVQAQADLSVSVTAPAGVNQGDTITYTVAVTNNGPSDAQGVQVVESLPANTTLISASFGQVPSALTGANLVTALGTVPAGASVTGTLVVRADLAGPATSSATVSGTTPDASPANDSVAATVNVAAAVASGAATALNGFEFSPLTNVTVATFTQPGAQPASAFGATIDWGDGTSSAGVVTGGNGNYAVVGSHTYTDEQVFSVTVTVTGPSTSLVLPTTATVLEQLLPDGTRGTPEQRFISEAVRDLFGVPVDPLTLSLLTPVFAQGEVQGAQTVLQDLLSAPFAPASLALFSNPKLLPNFLLSFGERAVVQVLQASPVYQGIPNPGVTPLDQLTADYGRLLDRPLDPFGAAAFLPILQGSGNDAVILGILTAGTQEYFNKTGP